MAITYHSGRRIQGLSTEILESSDNVSFSTNPLEATRESNFTSSPTGTATYSEQSFSSGTSGWATSNSTYMSLNNGTLKTNWYGNNAGDKCIVYDFGSGNVSNDKWVLRMKVNFGSSSGADNEGFIGISDGDQTEAKGSNQKFLGVCFLTMYTVDSSANGFYKCIANEGSLPPTNSGKLQYNFSASTDYFLEISRNYGKLTYSLFSDNTYSLATKLGTMTVPIPNITGLQYLKFSNYAGASTNLSNAYVDDISFWNNQNHVETGQTNPTTGGEISYNSSSGLIDIDFDGTSSEDRWWIDLGNVSDTQWEVQFSLKKNSHSGARPFHIHMSNVTSGDWVNVSQSGIGIYIDLNDGDGQFTLANSQRSTSGATTINSGTFASNGTTRYFTLKRISSTSIGLYIYSDSARTVLIGSDSYAISGNTGLRYFLVSKEGQQARGSSTVDAEFDDFKFYNGVVYDSTNDVIKYDLHGADDHHLLGGNGKVDLVALNGSALSTNWVLDFDIHDTGLVMDSTSRFTTFIGVVADELSGQGGSYFSNILGVAADIDDNDSSRGQYGIVARTNGYSDPNASITTATSIDNNDHWYVRFIRNGTDSKFTVEFYDNSARTGTPLTATQTSVTTATPYKYFGVWDDTDAGGSNKHIGEISQIKLYDGVTSLSSKPANVQVGSRLEETDTRNMYYLQGASTATYSDFTGTWTTDSGNEVQASNGVVSVSMGGSNRNDYISFDLGTPLSDSWVLRFKQQATTNTFTLNSGNAGAMYVSLSNGTNLSGEHNDGGSVNSINTRVRHHGTNWDIRTFDVRSRVSGTTTSSGDAGQVLATGAQTYYVEVIKDGATVSVKYFDDSAFSSQVGTTKSVSSSSIGTDLQYLGVHIYSQSHSSGDFVAQVSEFKIYDGITSVLESNTWSELGT